MKSKKAISPLIATVLIIGFTIVLAAVVIQWGGQLVDQLKGQTQTSTELSLACSSGLSDLKIVNAIKIGTPTPTEIQVTLDNKNEQLISGITFRKYFTGGMVTSDTNKTDMTAFSVIKYSVLQDTNSGDDFSILTKVGVMPMVTLSDGTEKVCSKELFYNFPPA